MKRAMRGAVVALALAGCTGDSVSLGVQVVIPAEVPTIEAGRLYLTLWAYDPRIADVGATLTDRDRVSFDHASGRRTSVFMHVGGHVSGGWRHYITVEGCQGRDAVLWDGLQGPSAPRTVEMQLRTTPATCRGDPVVPVDQP